MDVLNEDLILTLESCRGALKISDGLDTHIIWHNLNKYLKENGFELLQESFFDTLTISTRDKTKEIIDRALSR